MKSTTINKLIEFYNKRQLKKVTFIPNKIEDITATPSFCSKLKGINIINNQLQLLDAKNYRDSIYLKSHLHQIQLNYLESIDDQSEKKQRKIEIKEEGIQTTQQHNDQSQLIILPSINKPNSNVSIASSVRSININNNLINKSAIASLPRINKELSIKSLNINKSNQLNKNEIESQPHDKKEKNNEQCEEANKDNIKEKKQKEKNPSLINENNPISIKNDNNLEYKQTDNEINSNKPIIQPTESSIIIHDLNGERIEEKDFNESKSKANKAEDDKRELFNLKSELIEMQNAFNEIKFLTKKHIELMRKRTSESVKSKRNEEISLSNIKQTKIRKDYYYNIYLNLNRKDPFAYSKELSTIIDKRLKRNQTQLDMISYQFKHNK